MAQFRETHLQPLAGETVFKGFADLYQQFNDQGDIHLDNNNKIWIALSSWVKDRTEYDRITKNVSPNNVCTLGDFVNNRAKYPVRKRYHYNTRFFNEAGFYEILPFLRNRKAKAFVQWRDRKLLPHVRQHLANQFLSSPQHMSESSTDSEYLKENRNNRLNVDSPKLIRAAIEQYMETELSTMYDPKNFEEKIIIKWAVFKQYLIKQLCKEKIPVSSFKAKEWQPLVEAYQEIHPNIFVQWRKNGKPKSYPGF